MRMPNSIRWIFLEGPPPTTHLSQTKFGLFFEVRNCVRLTKPEMIQLGLIEKVREPEPGTQAPDQPTRTPQSSHPKLLPFSRPGSSYVKRNPLLHPPEIQNATSQHPFGLSTSGPGRTPPLSTSCLAASDGADSNARQSHPEVVRRASEGDVLAGCNSPTTTVPDTASAQGSIPGVRTSILWG
eukprot:Rmarinus@m.6452